MHTKLPPALFSLSLLLLTACNNADDTGVKTGTYTDEGGNTIDIAELEIRPDEAQVYTGPTGGASTPFEAWATLSDGRVTLLEDAEWSVSNRTTGEVDNVGNFTPASGHGGITYVSARFAGLEADALVTVTYQDTMSVDGAGAEAFTGGEVAHTDLWTYPQDNVNLPRNTPGITFQWTDVGASAARIHFRSAITDLTVYTTDTEWTADATTWALIAGTNAGGSVAVDLGLVVGGEVWTQSIVLNVNRMDGEGVIYYWSTSAAGIMRAVYGGQPTEFITPEITGHACQGCHAVQGDVIAFTYDGADGPLGVRTLDGDEIVDDDAMIFTTFKAYSPDGAYLLAVNNGSLLLYDTSDYHLITTIPTDGYATQPDWSPDGTRVAYVLADTNSADFFFTGGKIAVMEWAGSPAYFGASTVLYDPEDATNAYYPAWSPDSEWLAFDVSTEDSYDDATADVWVIAGDGGTPIELVNANITDGLTNSMPRWGPLPDDDVLWLAFSSKRAYGNLVTGNPQIWVSGFDPAKAAAGEDPTWPAFWLPGQDVNQNNHFPFWTR